jgi:hypothetical protein
VIGPKLAATCEVSELELKRRGLWEKGLELSFKMPISSPGDDRWTIEKKDWLGV